MTKSCPISMSLSSLIVLVLTLSLVATSASVTMAEPRGEIRIVENWRPDINVLGHNVLQYLFEYALDKNELTPSLALSREWIDDTTLEVKLRKGVRFHNGESFDANAVKFNFEYQRKHNPNRGVQFYMKNVQDIEVIDPFTVRFLLDQPNTLLLSSLVAGPLSGWVIGAPRYMEEVGWEKFLMQPIGTGPYKAEGTMKDHRQVSEGEVYARLLANPEYWNRELPMIQRIVFVQHSPKEALSALLEGRVDLVTSLIPKDTLKVAENPHLKVIKGREDVSWTACYFNLLSHDTFPLRDIRVRKALNYAVNKEELLHYAFKGNGVRMRGVLTEKSGVDLSETDPYEWDVQKARELLAWAGYGDGFKMELFYHEKDFLIARLIQRFYSLLKIEVAISPFTGHEWMVRHMVYPNARDDYSWDDEDWWMVIYSQPPAWPELMYGWLEWAFHSGAPWQTVPNWLMDPLDDMYRKVLRTKDRARRLQIYQAANQYIADQAFFVFTVAPLGLYGVNEELNFLPQVSQYLYLDYSSVTKKHWSLRGKNN